MKKSLSLIFATVLMGLGQANAQEVKSCNVTIYNTGNGVVREVRELDLKKGVAEYSITDVAEKLNPATVKISLKNASVIEQNFKYDLVSSSKILNKYIGKEITLIGDKTISGKLLSTTSNGVVIEKKEGGIIIVNNANSYQSNYQISVGELPEGFVLYPTLVWKINSEKSGKQYAEIMYQTQGLVWNAEYIAILNENDTKLDINTWISLNNTSGKSYKDAKLKLMAGNLKRNNYETIYVKSASMVLNGGASFSEDEPTTEKSFFEYHLYTVEAPTTIANSEKKQISMFDKSDISCTKVFKYSSNQYTGGEEKVHPKVFVNFANSEKNKMGMPLPEGNVRVFKFDGTDKELIGETYIKHTPKDEKVELEIGEAFDVVIDEKVINDNHISDKITEVEYEIEFRNRKSEPIEIEFEKSFLGQVEVLKSSIEPSEKEAKSLKLKVPIKKESITKVNLKVRVQNQTKIATETK